METIHAIWVSDPGHAWLAVPRRYVSRLKLHRMISRFSYAGTDVVYLEEDVDAPLFIESARAADHAIKIERELSFEDDCFVRQLPRF